MDLKLNIYDKKEITKTCKKRDSGAYYGSKIHAGVSYGRKKMWF